MGWAQPQHTAARSRHTKASLWAGYPSRMREFGVPILSSCQMGRFPALMAARRPWCYPLLPKGTRCERFLDIRRARFLCDPNRRVTSDPVPSSVGLLIGFVPLLRLANPPSTAGSQRA